MYILYFDICAAIVILTLMFSVISRKMISGISNRIFILLIAIILTADVFDLWSVALDVYPEEIHDFKTLIQVCG